MVIDYYADEKQLALAMLMLEQGKFPKNSEPWITVDMQIRRLRLDLLLEYQTRGNA